MKAIEINALVEGLQLQRYANTLIGIVDGWPICIPNVQTQQIRVDVNLQNNMPMIRETTGLVKANGGSVTWRKNVLIFTYRTKKLQDDLCNYVRRVLATLTRAGLSPQDVCPICGSSGCDTAAIQKGGFGLTHRHCLEMKGNAAINKAVSNQDHGNRVTGIIGAFLGMIVGTLPSLLTITAMDYEYAVLFALIPICSYFGYKLLNGKMDKFALVISIIMGILGVYVLIYEQIVVELMQEYGLGLGDSMSLTLSLILDIETLIELTVQSIVEFFFAAIGIFIAWRSISRTSMDEVRDADTILKTSMPYSNPNSNDSNF